jgi:hypothetical protein
MSDARELYLIEEIDKLQDQKLDALRSARQSSGLEKVRWLDQFMELNKKQQKLEEELEDDGNY